MSLITEALQLRKANPRNRGAGGESFPPMRRPNPAGKVLLGLFLFCGLGVLVFWKGTWAVEQLENLAGIHVPRPALAGASPAPASKAVQPVAPEKTEMVAAPALLAPRPEAAEKNPGPSGGEAAAPSKIAAASGTATAEEAREKPPALPAPMDVNLTLSMIEDEKARQQLDEENQRKIESFLRRMDIQGVCHQGENSTALLDTVLVRPGDPVGDLGLTLRMIEARRLVFADRNGREYTKSY